jgi:hypothetical protein
MSDSSWVANFKPVFLSLAIKTESAFVSKPSLPALPIIYLYYPVVRSVNPTLVEVMITR